MRFAIGFVILFVLISGIFLTSCQNNNSTAISSDSVDFNLHIRPILSDRCFKCHGPDANQRKSNLRLDTREGALAALKGFVPGTYAANCLLARKLSEAGVRFVQLYHQSWDQHGNMA